MRIIIARHGETLENLAGILQGHLPGKLSENGKEQAKKLAYRLKDERIDFIYSSDLARAADTAREIISYHNKAEIYFLRELRESDLGCWAGLKLRDVAGKNPACVESLESLQLRAKCFLDKVYNKPHDSTILIVSHNWIGRAIVNTILDKPVKYLDNLDQPNASISIFDVDENKNVSCLLMNCTLHLNN